MKHNVGVRHQLKLRHQLYTGVSEKTVSFSVLLDIVILAGDHFKAAGLYSRLTCGKNGFLYTKTSLTVMSDR